MKLRILIWGLLSIILSGLFATVYFQAHYVRPMTIQKALDASVVLHLKTVRIKDGRWLIGCSGTYIDPTHILTAAHCFNEYQVEYVWARGPNDTAGYPVYLVGLDSTRDLALLESPHAHPFAKLGKPIKQGNGVFNVGSPMQFEFLFSDGVVAAVGFRVPGFLAHYVVTTAMINSGSSGGGCFDIDGRLVGVNTMSVGMFGWAGISLAVDVEDVRAFLLGVLK
jgi:S1-C subfamily serine protease